MDERPTRDSSARDLFLRRVRERGHEVVSDNVIARDNIYRVDGRVHLMVRTSRLHEPRDVYFFGLTHHIFENFALLANAVIAFVMSDTSDAILVPASWMWEQRDKLSADPKQVKLEISKSLHLRVLKGKGNSIDLRQFHERFEILRPAARAISTPTEEKRTSDKHSSLQGMLLEIGNLRGYQTYCPNKSPKFRSRPLGQIATIGSVPEFPGLSNDIIRQIDVIWFDKLFPAHAFEVELTTGIWSGLVRLAELRRLNTVFHVVTDGDSRAFHKRVAGDIFSDIVARCHHASEDEVRVLLDVESRTHELRKRLALS